MTFYLGATSKKDFLTVGKFWTKVDMENVHQVFRAFLFTCVYIIFRFSCLKFSFDPTAVKPTLYTSWNHPTAHGLWIQMIVLSLWSHFHFLLDLLKLLPLSSLIQNISFIMLWHFMLCRKMQFESSCVTTSSSEGLERVTGKEVC